MSADGRQTTVDAVQRSLRDLMGLMTLPALWVGKDAATVLQLMTEAVERLIKLQVCFVDVCVDQDESAIRTLRLAGAPASPAESASWQTVLESFTEMPISSAPVLQSTPVGPLQVVRLSMGYSSRGGSVWFGSNEAAFPSSSQLAFLRTAATLAATGLQAARIDRERERASRAKDEFLAMLGHELRNPLAPIFSALELIKREHRAPLSPPHAIIERQARHLSWLVDDLLDVSRIARGKVELHKQLIDLRPVLTTALEAIEPLIEKHGHTLTARLPEQPVPLFGDTTRLTQVFVNLLTNAAKYTPNGGQITLDAAIDGQTVVVRVRDNGPGISDELRPRLFRIFEQGSSTIDRSGGGLGIGLALVKSFVSLHEGRVTEQPAQPGPGCEFTVELPLSSDAVVSGQPGSRSETPDVVRKQPVCRVLLVDDNVDAVETTAEILRDSDLEVLAVFDPFEALRVLESFKPTVAVIDIGLPGMDGYQLAAQLRRRDGELRLIALSGYGQPDDHRKSLAAGFEAHLVKPVDFDRLIAAVTEGRASE